MEIEAVCKMYEKQGERERQRKADMLKSYGAAGELSRKKTGSREVFCDS